VAFRLLTAVRDGASLQQKTAAITLMSLEVSIIDMALDTPQPTDDGSFEIYKWRMNAER
jgi:hypothetical protein